MPLPVFAVFAVSASVLNLSWVVVGLVNILMEDAPETTAVNQHSDFYAYVVEYWNSCWANEVFWREKDQEMSLYDKLQSFPYFWRICGSLFRRVVEIVFCNFCGRAGLKLRPIDFLSYLWLHRPGAY